MANDFHQRCKLALTHPVTLSAVALLLLAACDQAPDHGYLEKEIPPCTPVLGPTVDPCDPVAKRISFNLGHPDLRGVDAPASVREMLGDSPRPAWVTHFVLHGTYLPGTGRCTAGDPFRPAAYLQGEFGDMSDTSTEWSIKCYMDVRANAYMVGSGPPSFTALVLRFSEGGDTRTEEEKELIEYLKNLYEYLLNAAFSGREHVMFFGPPVDLSSEAWRVLGYWDVQRQEKGAVIVEHPDIELWELQRPEAAQTHRSKLMMELPSFAKLVVTVHQERVTEYGGRIGADVSLPMLVTDVHRLRDYYTEVGAYAPGAPTPAQPPPPYPKAELGKEYPYELFTNCALFGGRFWLADPPLHDGNGNLLPEWENPTTKGVMMLAREDLAVFTGRSGQIAEFVPWPPEVEFGDNACVWP